MVTYLMAQVMTRGMVKSTQIIIIYDKWVIRSQVPIILGMQFID